MKSIVLSALIAISLISSGGAAKSRLQQKNVQQQQDQKEFEEYQAALADATPVVAGQLSERDRKHSELFDYYKARRSDRTISGLAALDKRKYKLVQTRAKIGLEAEITEPDTPEHFFGWLASQSDTIVRGRAVRKVSQITENDGFVFTDYDVVVSEILKNNIKNPFKTDTTIVVTRPGGTVLLNDVIVKAVDDAFKKLPINDLEVVLFLKYIPETGTYTVPLAVGSFEIDGSKLRPLTEAGFAPGVLEDSDSFLHVLRALRYK